MNGGDTDDNWIYRLRYRKVRTCDQTGGPLGYPEWADVSRRRYRYFLHRSYSLVHKQLPMLR